MWHDVDEDLVFCPYNPHHIISKLKIQKHLIKCQKSHPHIKLATCFYNYSHKVRPEDLLKHYETCSHKTRMEGSRYYNPVDSSTSDENSGFNFPKITVRTQKHFYNPYKFPRDPSKNDFECENDFEDSDFESEDVLLGMHKTTVENEDDNSDDMKPLPLPKTVSKAFTCLKQPSEQCSAETNVPNTSHSVGFGRAKSIMKSAPPKTTHESWVGVRDSGILSPERKASKFSSKNTNSCDASVISSSFDDANTLTSQDIAFDDDDDDDVENFILKNFDKYTKIEKL